MADSATLEKKKHPEGPAVEPKGYKKDQGRMARMFAFWSLTLLCLFGCNSLYTVLSSRVDALDRALVDAVPEIPILGWPLNGAFVITTALFLGGAFLLLRYLERPKSADLLIDTESELRKVSWPTLDEVINSSVVVIILVVVLMAYMAGADWFLGRVAQRLLGGG